MRWGRRSRPAWRPCRWRSPSALVSWRATRSEGSMDHAEVREHLELAALEPGRVRRVPDAVGDDAQRVREHLAACPACRREAEALGTTSAALAWAAPDAMRAPDA